MKKISFGVLSIPLKKILTIIVTILIFENLYSTEPVNFTKAPENLSKELLERTWSFELIGIKHIYISITFKNDNTYTLYSPFGGELADGTYSFKGNTVTINPSNSHNYKHHEQLFVNGNPLVLVYDSNYITMDFVGALKNDSIILTNGIEKTPINSQCWLDGRKVLKEHMYIEAIDNVRLRLAPSLSGTITTYCYNHYFPIHRDELSKAGYKIALDDFNGKCDTLNVLLKGMVCESIAHTIEKETIDGISDYWYYIRMTDYTDPGWTEYYWVFGGYIKIVNSPNDNLPVLFEAAKEKGILIKK